MKPVGPTILHPVAILPTKPSTAPTGAKATAWADPAPSPTPRVASVRNRFSLAKTAQLVDYHRTTTTHRQLAVVALFAVPSALTSLASCLVPLHAPSPRAIENGTFWGHFVVTFVLSYAGTMAQVRAAAAIPHAHYTNRDIVAVSVVATGLLLALTLLVATYWHFPIPFLWVVIMAPWLLCLGIANIVVLRGRLQILARPLLGYAPSLVVQVSQIAIYPAYSALFEAAGDNEKLVLIVFFPVLKFGLKRSIFALTRTANRELSSEIAVSGVEICASMYQSMIMQSTPSTLATALVIGMDVVHGLIDVRRFLTHHGSALSSSSRTDVLVTLERLVDAKHGASSIVCDESELSRFGTRSGAIPLWTSRRQVSTVSPIAPQEVEKARLTLALEMLQSAETIVLVEYIEVAVPLVNAVYVGVASQFESALFNPRLRCFYGHAERLRPAVASVVLYTALQGLTLAAMAVAMERRMKMSALTLLAFVLEGHFWSLQGKMISWMCVLFVFSVVHYGTYERFVLTVA